MRIAYLHKKMKKVDLILTEKFKRETNQEVEDDLKLVRKMLKTKQNYLPTADPSYVEIENRLKELIALRDKYLNDQHEGGESEDE